MGSLRFRKSRKIGPGIRFSVTKTGVGMSVGAPGARYSVHSSGRHTSSIGVPGTGVSFRNQKGGGSGGSKSTRQTAGRTKAPPPTVQVRRPGLFASATDKRWFDGLIAYSQGDLTKSLATFEAVAAADPSAVSAHFLAGVSALMLDMAPKAVSHLESVVESDQPLPDRYMAKMLPSTAGLHLEVKITENITAALPYDGRGASLALAELYQSAGRLEEAIGIVQQVSEAAPDDPFVALSLADLLYADGDLDGVVETTEGAANDSDLGVALLHLRAASLFGLGHQVGAFDTFKAALAKTAGRDPELLKLVRYDRAVAYDVAGEKKKARADLEKLYAADHAYRDVAELLASETTAGPARAPVERAAPVRDIGATLASLAAMRDRGLITPAEYEAKKRELLARL
jgi:tetratricopeptide (TPR) repeat protein